mmetsp:Transcript_7365/g.10433  ORF Transcript_7365/g.10433 Transcript_7365/m.10433 type:complete len:135 (+) Transcript_7365:1177-1581(+)
MQFTSVPPESFLYSDKDYKTKLEVCHIGIIGAKFNDMQFWVLGQAFMENFYTVFDASDPNNLKVGLSLPTVHPVTHFMEIGAIALLCFIGLAFVVIFLSICYKARQNQRLDKAKTQLDIETLENDVQQDMIIPQ